MGAASEVREHGFPAEHAGARCQPLILQGYSHVGGRTSVFRLGLGSVSVKATAPESKQTGECVLLERGHVSAADLNAALQEQQAQARLVHLGELMQRGMVSKTDLTAALMEVAQIPRFDCTTAQIEPKILRAVPKKGLR